MTDCALAVGLAVVLLLACAEEEPELLMLALAEAIALPVPLLLLLGVAVRVAALALAEALPEALMVGLTVTALAVAEEVGRAPSDRVAELEGWAEPEALGLAVAELVILWEAVAVAVLDTVGRAVLLAPAVPLPVAVGLPVELSVDSMLPVAVADMVGLWLTGRLPTVLVAVAVPAAVPVAVPEREGVPLGEAPVLKVLVLDAVTLLLGLPDAVLVEVPVEVLVLVALLLLVALFVAVSLGVVLGLAPLLKVEVAVELADLVLELLGATLVLGLARTEGCGVVRFWAGIHGKGFQAGPGLGEAGPPDGNTVPFVPGPPPSVVPFRGTN